MQPALPRTASLVSFRLGTADGVSVAAAQWCTALRSLGVTVRTVAGGGVADVIVPGLAIDASERLRPGELAAAIADSDVVIADNLASLPLNPSATTAFYNEIEGRPAVLRHHDFTWERVRFAHIRDLPRDSPHWKHVTISQHARESLRITRGISATTIYHGVDSSLTPSTRRAELRSLLGIKYDERVVLQPTRAIPRKRVDLGLRLAEELDAIFWLTGPAEEGFQAELDALLGSARGRVIRAVPSAYTMSDVYGASDIVVIPSDWEGFGLPLIESAMHYRPLVVSDFAVARELRNFGFNWLDLDDVELARKEASSPRTEAAAANHATAVKYFGTDALQNRLAALLALPYQDTNLSTST